MKKRSNGKTYEVWFGKRNREYIPGNVLVHIGNNVLYYEKSYIGQLNNREDAIRQIYHYWAPEIVIVEKPTNKIIFERKSGKNLVEIREEDIDK